MAGMQSAVFSPYGRHIVGADGEKGVCIWDTKSGELLVTVKGHKWMVEAAQFSHDGSHVVSCSADSIRFWDFRSLETSWKGNSTNNASKGAIDSPNPDINIVSKPWTINNDGWVVDQQQQRLVWIPCDLQVWLQPFPNDFVISHRNSREVKFNRVKIGEKWTDCYRASCHVNTQFY